MFSDYASRLIHQSQNRLTQHQKPKPLFQSLDGNHVDTRDPTVRRQTGSGVTARLGEYLTPYEEDHIDHSDEEDTSAMRSSWRPSQQPLPSDRAYSPSPAHSVIHTTSNSIPRPYDIDEEGDAASEHSQAPTDVMFGIALSNSPPKFAAIDNRASADYLPESEDSIIMDKSTLPELTSQVGAFSHHDPIFAFLFMLSHAASLTTSIFVYLRTDTLSSPVADSVYVALKSSMGMIVQYALIAFLISILWLGSIRVFIRPLFYGTIVAVPLLSLIFSFYTVYWSYKGPYGGYEVQARAMRWSALALAGFAAVWTYTALRRRHTLDRSIHIINLACSILNENLTLIVISLASVVVFILYTLLWIQQFERIFLRGAFDGVTGTTRWLVRGDSWILGICLAFLFLWTFGVVSGVQRAATSAIVSQWYFHRHDLPKSDAVEVGKAAVIHSLTTTLGTICGSSLNALLTRLPLLILPKRVSGFLGLFAYMLFSAPITNLTNPLTLSFAAIHSIAIFDASRSMSKHTNLSPTSPQVAYRTAKMLLGAVRATTALALGTLAWIASARSATDNGSLYAYIVGLIAGMIGWAIVGSVESILSIIVDAALVCYSIDLPNSREGRAHCTAADVFRQDSSLTNGGGRLHV